MRQLIKYITICLIALTSGNILISTCVRVCTSTVFICVEYTVFISVMYVSTCITVRTSYEFVSEFFSVTHLHGDGFVWPSRDIRTVGYRVSQHRAAA